MSEEHGPRAWEKEKAAIDDAYADRIKKLFEVFHFDVGGKDPKEAALARFKTALEALRRSHVQALSIFSDHDKI